MEGPEAILKGQLRGPEAAARRQKGALPVCGGTIDHRPLQCCCPKSSWGLKIYVVIAGFLLLADNLLRDSFVHLFNALEFMTSQRYCKNSGYRFFMYL